MSLNSSLFYWNMSIVEINTDDKLERNSRIFLSIVEEGECLTLYNTV